MIEEWQEIKGYPRYRVSSFGRVEGPGRHERLILKPTPQHNGYYRVSVIENKKMKTITVHSLVAAAFIGPRPSGLQIDHKDGNKQNNNVSNLRYVTPQENSQYSVNMGFSGTRDNHWCAKLTSAKVEAIRTRYHRAPQSNSNLLAKEYGVSVSTIRRIISNKRWRPDPRLEGNSIGEKVAKLEFKDASFVSRQICFTARDCETLFLLIEESGIDGAKKERFKNKLCGRFVVPRQPKLESEGT